MTFTFSGLRIVESVLLCDRKQVKFPRSKKRRIRRKWAKRDSNFIELPKREILKYGDTLVCHPMIAAEVRKAIQREAERYAEKWL